MRIPKKLTLSVLTLIALGAAASFAQSTFGTILGTIKDSTGALMPGCVITIENIGTSVKRSALADENGSYSFPNLEPGTYKLTIMAPGFQVAEYTNVQLLARQTIRIDGQMAAAFAIPQNNIGRQGSSPVGSILGPGTQAVSLSLFKSFNITEGIRFALGAAASNAFNHPNYAVPNLNYGTAPFGTIANVQSAEGTGPRQFQITSRLTF